eukprot:46845-Eustigmatos_ZCMA.PRE.1
MPVLRNEVQITSPPVIIRVPCTVPQHIAVFIPYDHIQVEMVKDPLRLVQCQTKVGHLGALELEKVRDVVVLFALTLLLGGPVVTIGRVVSGDEDGLLTDSFGAVSVSTK